MQKDASIRKGRSSGGIIIYYKKYLEKLINEIKQTKHYIWIDLSKELFYNLNNNLKICVIYNPPKNSKYYNSDLIEDIETDILDFCNDGSQFLLIGDMNARTGIVDDYCISDEKNIKSFITNIDVEGNHPKTRRNNCDFQINQEGLKIIQLCKSLDLMILNGRINGDFWGNYTHFNKNNGESTVDLGIVSCKLFNSVKSFRVMPQLDISDHCKIITQIDNIRLPDCEKNEKVENYKWNKLPNKYKWKDVDANIFIDTLNSEKIKNIISEAEQRIEAGLIESTGEKIQEIFYKSADICLKQTKYTEITGNKKLDNKKSKRKKKWFDLNCKNLKSRVNTLSTQKHKYPMNIMIREEHKQLLKMYKSLCKFKQMEFWKREGEKFKNNNLKFWDIWKTLGEDEIKPQYINANGEEWESYFSNLYKNHIESENENFESIEKNTSNDMLNKPFTMTELKSIIKSLKKNKATGYDKICNEFIKLSTERIQKLLLDFLNLTLSKSKITSNWCIDILNPIHKGESKSNPDNYRGICIMNSLLKVLCLMMNSRLNEYCEKNNLINVGQIGFKKESRTSDHLLTLKSIVNKYVYDNKGKLYTCFVDFKKAFDSIWHKALFHKLETNNINGNFLELLKNIYKQSKCAVKINNKLTNFFIQEKGVRQGDPLSPTLFNIYINDLFDELEKSNDNFVTLNNIDKIRALMFADDLILISTSKEGLQNSLDVLNNYVKKWKLEINYKKTKCVTFSKGNQKEKHQFNINNHNLDNVVKYKYLGLTINKKGSFLPSLEDLSCKAKRAIYAMNSKINLRFLSIKTQLNLFDRLVCPILLYGSEVWEPFVNQNQDKWDNSAIEKVHTQFLKRILGVNRSTSNIMVRADLGRYPLKSCILLRNIRYLKQINQKDDKTLVRQAYSYENIHYEKRINIENTARSFENKLKDILNEEFSIYDLSNYKLKKYINLVFCEDWSTKLTNSSKADSFKLFKSFPKFESLYDHVNNRKHLNSLTKFRLSDHKLLIEEGRRKRPILPRNERLCKNCNIIEDETHFLIDCKLFDNDRREMFRSIVHEFPRFAEINDSKTKFIFLMSQENKKVTNTIAFYIHKCFFVRENM